MIAVDKIGMSTGREPGEQRMGRSRVEHVPPHMRDFERAIAGLDRNDLSTNPAEPLDRLALAAAIRRQLHADADTEKRASTNHHRLAQCWFKAGYCGKPTPAIGKGSDAGQDDPISAGERFRVTGDLDLSGDLRFCRRALEGFRRRTQGARAVIDDHDLHGRLPRRTPWVDGPAPARRGSISTACRRARARPLKQDSTMWWLFSP